jgi:hypothetical protein
VKSYGKSGRVAETFEWAKNMMPNEANRTALASTYIELCRENATEEEVIKTLAGAVYDGYAYGNWPLVRDPKQKL